MTNDNTIQYAFQTKLQLPYEQAIERVTAALKEEGFGVLTEIDVKETLKQKLDAEFRKYVILGACNPHLAHQALGIEPGLGLLLPCNVIVYEDNGDSIVSIIDPTTMLAVANNPQLDPVAQEAHTRLQRVYSALTA